MTVTCDYCGNETEKTTGARVYPGRPDLATKIMFACFPCGAWVGCHPGADKPLGRMANKALRGAKMDAHAAFDPLWKGQPRGERSPAYAWLAESLNISPDKCHIGMFDVDQCRAVQRACYEKSKEKAAP